jgi:hypothetical protein
MMIHFVEQLVTFGVIAVIGVVIFVIFRMLPGGEAGASAARGPHAAPTAVGADGPHQEDDHDEFEDELS